MIASYGFYRAPGETAQRLQVLAACLLCLAWILPGLTGHDPWKPDEAYTFGIVYHIIRTGDLVIPTLAGEPFMEKPPLFYLVAALFGRVFSPPLPLHDAVRLASGFFMGLTFLLTGLTGRELYGRNGGWIAAIILLGCLGLLVRTHQLITDVALLTGFALALYGLALALRRPLAGGLLLGTGVGVGFLSKGLLAPGVLGVTALLLLLFRAWRTRGYLVALVVALVAASPWLLVWPYEVYQRSPALFYEWFWVNNFGRFLGFVNLGPPAEPAHYLSILPWYGWPALPLALWTLWHEGRAGLRKPGIRLPLAFFLVTLAVLSFAADARELYALPLLLPLALLAAASVDSLRRGAANALDWFGIMTFGLIAALLWLGWFALLTGRPQAIQQRLLEYQPGFEPHLRIWTAALAALLSVGWLWLVARVRPSPRRALVNWASGITLVWALLGLLWLPFIDAGKSYRSMVASLVQALPAGYRCIASTNLGEGQRAMLEYFAGIVTKRTETQPDAGCDMMLVQTTAADKSAPERHWQLLWEGARPGDNVERYRLYRRAGG